MSSITVIRDRNNRPVKHVARYRTPDGKSRSRTFKLEADAKAFLATVDTSKITGAFVDPKATRITFKEYAEAWVSRQPHRATTADGWASAMATHLLPAFGPRRLATIRPSDVQAWVTALDLAPSTTAVIYGKLAAIFRSAVEDRLITHSPCGRSIRLPRKQGDEVVPMAPADVRAMADAVGDRYRALVVLLAGTGVRPGEALGLTVDRVDFLRRTIRVDRQLLTQSGEVPRFGPTKTPQSVRTIPAPQVVLDALAAHIERYAAHSTGLLFTDAKGDPIRRNALGHVWRRAAKKAKVTDRSPHDLRHYAASVLIEAGSSVKAVQKHLGHASATTTLDTYAHLWPDSGDATRKALEAGLLAALGSDAGRSAAAN